MSSNTTVAILVTRDKKNRLEFRAGLVQNADYLYADGVFQGHGPRQGSHHQLNLKFALEKFGDSCVFDTWQECWAYAQGILNTCVFVAKIDVEHGIQIFRFDESSFPRPGVDGVPNIPPVPDGALHDKRRRYRHKEPAHF